MPVVATAGHVDHGKSALVQSLTGRDPDRWEAEKRRGMTIDLGFAWTTLPSGRQVSFVDVPGHRRFMANMLAGIGPVDPQQVEDRQMLLGLRHPTLVGRDDQQGGIDRSDSRKHVGHEPAVIGHVYEGDLTSAWQGRPGEAQVDGHSPTLLLLPPVGIATRQRLDKRRLTVINMAGGR